MCVHMCECVSVCGYVCNHSCSFWVFYFRVEVIEVKFGATKEAYEKSGQRDNRAGGSGVGQQSRWLRCSLPRPRSPSSQLVTRASPPMAEAYYLQV